MLCGLGYVADSMWFGALPAILPKVQQEFSLPDSIAGLGTTWTVIGMILGAIGFGFYASIYGRRSAFLITFIIATLFGLSASFSPSFVVLCLALGFVGIGIGGNIPVDASLFLESIPSQKQYLLTFLTIFWSIANVLSTFLAWILIPRFSCTESPCESVNNRGWRYLLVTLGLLSLVMLSIRLCMRRIFETPRFLVSRKRYRDAVLVLQTLAKQNNVQIDVTPEDLEIEHDSETAWSKFVGKLWLLVGPSMFRYELTSSPFRTSFFLWAVWFLSSLGLGIFGSFIIVFLQGSQQISVDETYRNYLIITMSAVPGTILAAYTVDSWLGRRGLMAISAMGTAASLFLFARFPDPTGQLVASCVSQFLANILYFFVFNSWLGGASCIHIRPKCIRLP